MVTCSDGLKGIFKEFRGNSDPIFREEMPNKVKDHLANILDKKKGNKTVHFVLDKFLCIISFKILLITLFSAV